MKHLKFIVEGPLQAWGVPSAGEYTPTAPGPTHRGIVGLIACCMGIPSDSTSYEILLEMLSISYDVNIINGIKKSGKILIDYQTISKPDGSNLDSADGGLADSKTVVRRKAYIQDASFTVHVSGPDDIMDEIYQAMNDPIWFPYLGRKCCIPTVPLIPEWE